GQTALNFLVHGPDAWGAKTSAFIQGNFTGQTTNNGSAGTRYGTFTLTHAYMDFTWATTKLTVGQTWQLWGFQPSYNFIGLNDMALAGRGTYTVPQISVTQNFTKSFYGSFGIQEPYKTADQLGASNSLGEALAPTTIVKGVLKAGASPTVASQLPDFAAEIGYKSDSAGRIGPNVMQFAVGGFWGQDSVVYALPTTFRTDHVDRWAGAFKAFIPLIPEKNLNKAGALSLSGSVFTGQNLSNMFLNARGTGALLAYDADPGPGVRYTVPVTTGGWGQISYYITYERRDHAEPAVHRQRHVRREPCRQARRRVLVHRDELGGLRQRRQQYLHGYPQRRHPQPEGRRPDRKNRLLVLLLKSTHLRKMHRGPFRRPPFFS
ncbi:MAG: hypothetical protein ABSB94_20355, partial [Syntrophorhabdales bacterium]